MAEGWEDWPLLGPGWKRKTVVRKSGNSCGHSDTYYQSPTGQRFRSKPELSKYLGEAIDLTLFNFKHGTLITKHKQTKTKKKSVGLKSQVEAKPEKPVGSNFEKSRVSSPVASPEKEAQNGTDDKSIMVRCNGCKTWLSGVEPGRAKKRITFYCPDCSASRREFNKEQRRLKSTGCGKCAACVLTEDCGHCSICVLRLKDPELGGSWKCTKRRCLKAIHKPGDCGLCQGCTATEDCEACTVCLKRQKNPLASPAPREHESNGLPGPIQICIPPCCKREEELQSILTIVIIKAKYNNGVALPIPAATSTTTTKLQHLVSSLGGKKLEAHIWSSSEADRFCSNLWSSSNTGRKVGRRRNRKCGTCEACQRKLDCGECDFCLDKPKFGGRNLKRQKCRWRQCLRFAAEKNIPVNLKSSNHPVILERLQREKMDAEKLMGTLKCDQGMQMFPRLPIIKLERLDVKNGGLLSKQGGSWVIGSTETKPVQKELVEKKESQPVSEECVGRNEVESNVMEQEIQEEPLDLHYPVKSEEFIVETDDVEGPDESTPVITQVYSLGPRNDMEQVLVEFLNELIEMPLPAHWEVLPQVGPTLKMIQKSKSSTMSETVVHIQPGLHFHVDVKGYTVPSSHELFRNHPSRLTTVDEVVELICDLEAYRPCACLSRRGLYFPNCHVLTIEERCPPCSALSPWPSGFCR
ncbi:methyl-CpG-binding domain protein 1-like [Gastrophryne carolinensis]